MEPCMPGVVPSQEESDVSSTDRHGYTTKSSLMGLMPWSSFSTTPTSTGYTSRIIELYVYICIVIYCCFYFGMYTILDLMPSILMNIIQILKRLIHMMTIIMRRCPPVQWWLVWGVYSYHHIRMKYPMSVCLLRLSQNNIRKMNCLKMNKYRVIIQSLVS